MIDIPLKTKQAFDRNSLNSINQSSPYGIISAESITKINTQSQSRQNVANHTGSSIPQNSNQQQITRMSIPPLIHPIQKGQKTTLFEAASGIKLSARFGWNTTNSQCDVDVSAFLLGDNGRVIGDSWFVFYGQETSPDNSVVLSTNAQTDRETITIDFGKLNPNVKKIVFVLTINEAFEKNLNFGMMKDAYVRILNQSSQSELVSFQMTEYYSNVISMMIGEIYQYHNSWKFNAVGNGVSRDLAGLCQLYGVEII